MKFFQNLSLKRRLVLLLLGMIVIVWTMVTLSAYYTIRTEMRKLLDNQIAQVAYALMEINLEKISEYEAKIPESVHSYLRGDLNNFDIRYQIWKGGQLQLQSLAAPAYRLKVNEGFSDLDLYNKRWRILRISVPGVRKTDVYVLARHDIETFFLHPFSELIIMHMSVQMILMIIIIWFAVGTGLRPLKTMAKAIGQRHYHDLTPLDGHVPDELKPVVLSVNKLFERLQKSFESEKQFTNHAAHELRTPLAALKMQAQVAMQEKDPAKQKKQLQNIVQGVNRAAHLVSQLLLMARIEPESENRLDMERIDVIKIIQSVSKEMQYLLDNKNIELYLPNDEAFVLGDRASLEIMFKNIIDNAIRYSPENSKIHIYYESKDDFQELIIDDEGPGIPEDFQSKVFDRFYRIPGTQAEGVGIGLSIVKKIADLHGANIIIASAPDGKGARIIVRFSKL